MIAARLAEALIHVGRLDEARSWIARATADLPAGDALLPSAWLTAGDAARLTHDYPAALAAYDKAAPLALAAGDQATARSAKLALADAAVTLDPARSATELDAILALPAVSKNKLELAQLEDMRARAAIIAGDRDAAVRWITRAVDHSGGLTSSNVSYPQANIRGDAAIIHRLRGNDEQARTYLSFTGAGHMKDMNWVGAFQGELPICGVDGVEPQDSAVVQFVLGEDGTVAAAIPVYASRGGEVGATFARAVGTWRWKPALIKDVAGFWRSTLRLELRCTSRPAPEALARPYVGQVLDWLVSRALLTRDEARSVGPDATNIGVTVSDNAIVRALTAVPAGGSAKRELPFAEAERLLDEAHAPPSAYALLVIRHAAPGEQESIRASAHARAAAMAPLLPAVTQRSQTIPPPHG